VNTEKTKLYVSAGVTAPLTGVPVLKVTNTRDILPEHVRLSYMYATVEEQTVWICRSAQVSGHRVLKPAPDGSQRLGQEVRSGEWYSTLPLGLEDLKFHREIPSWLRDLIVLLRPDGNVELPGA
jgi:hypothetical protein